MAAWLQSGPAIGEAWIKLEYRGEKGPPLRLARLQSSKLVGREIVRSGRGRPHYVYQVTQSGLKELGDNYSDLALIIWREMKNIEESDVRERIVNRVRNALVERYGRVVHGETLDERMSQLESALVERGFDVEFDSGGSLPILRENNCPYPELASMDSTICELEQEVFQQVLGVPVTLTQCCLDGHHCCEFQASESQGKEDESIEIVTPSATVAGFPKNQTANG